MSSEVFSNINGSVILHGKPRPNSTVPQSLIALLSSGWTKIPTYFYSFLFWWGSSPVHSLIYSLESCAFLSSRVNKKISSDQWEAAERQACSTWSFCGSKQQSPSIYRQIIGKMPPGSSQQGLERQWGAQLEMGEIQNGCREKLFPQDCQGVAQIAQKVVYESVPDQLDKAFNILVWFRDWPCFKHEVGLGENLRLCSIQFIWWFLVVRSIVTCLIHIFLNPYSWKKQPSYKKQSVKAYLGCVFLKQIFLI